MKKSRPLRIGILICSVSLAAWFVAYRSGAFAPASPEPAPQEQAAQAVAQDVSLAAPTKMHVDSFYLDESMMALASSKSGKIFYPDSPKKETPANDGPDDTFMGSSKNDGIFEPEPVDSPAKVHHDDDFMRSSKSGDIFRPNEAVQTRQVNGANNANQAPTPANANPAPIKKESPTFMGTTKSGPVFQSKPVIFPTPKTPEHKE